MIAGVVDTGDKFIAGDNKYFYLKIFIFFRRCRWHRWQTFIREYLREFSKKFEMFLMGYSGARGTLIYEKNLKAKISCQTPFKGTQAWDNLEFFFT